MATRSADFELLIGDVPKPGADRATKHRVQVTSPHGPEFEVMELDTEEPGFAHRLSAAAGQAPTFELRKAAGELLFARLFQGKVLICWHGSLGRLKGGEFDTLRVRLWFCDSALAALPWELLYDDSHFLATDVRLTISRYLPGPEPSYLAPVPKLRVLGIESRPTKGNLQQIPQEAVDELRKMFDKLGGKVEYHPLPNPTLETVRAKLADDFHVLHYLGHGVPNELVFTAADGTPQPIRVENLRQIMSGRRTLRVVVLNACASAQAGVGDVFAGVGPGLVQIGLPAVLAMQYNFVYLDVATAFNTPFYKSLVGGSTVDAAVTEGRQGVSSKDVADRGWSTPVLYLGTRGGQGLMVDQNPLTPYSLRRRTTLMGIVLAGPPALPLGAWAAFRLFRWGATNTERWTYIFAAVAIICLIIGWWLNFRKQGQVEGLGPVWFVVSALLVLGITLRAYFTL